MKLKKFIVHVWPMPGFQSSSPPSRTVDAHSYEVESGALKFYDDSGVLLGAFGPGAWIRVAEIVS